MATPGRHVVVVEPRAGVPKLPVTTGFIELVKSIIPNEEPQMPFSTLQSGAIVVLSLVVATIGGLRYSKAQSTEEETQKAPATIERSSIWSMGVWDTKQLESLPDSHQNLWKIRKALRTIDHPAPAGFAVKGTGIEALQGAYRVLVDQEVPQERFSADDDISLVVFSLSSSPRLEIERVEKTDREVTVAFSLRHRIKREVKSYLALIPLGAVAPGELHVKMAENPEVDEAGGGGQPLKQNAHTPNSIVSKSFSFTIEKMKEQ